MSTYVMSDLHGQYDAYVAMLEKIDFQDNDMLYILGDVVDRGPHPVKILLDLMKRPNVVCLAGNHEFMAMSCMKFLMQEVTEENLDELDEDTMESLLEWQMNGCESTIRELQQLGMEDRKEVLRFISEFDLYEEVEVGEEKYVLVHAGLGGFNPDKELWEYDIHDMIWERPDYDLPYYADRYVINGHTPTQILPGNEKPGFIYRKNRHIDIDCGAAFGGNLACLCLETGEEFYVNVKEKEKIDNRA